MSDVAAQLGAALAGRYTVARELGHGGMALVFLAHDIKHDRNVAIKVLRPELAAALGAERFLREITIAAQLHHPLILPLYDSGEAEGLLYYVMPLVEGESLRDRLQRETQLPLEDTLQITREVADALSYAHSRDVVHRDIKPENILLESGHALVADFGIARAITAAGGEQLTNTGLAIGTPSYMSPEQASGEQRIDGRSDIYSLGCVAYEMLVGEPPYTGPTAQAIMARRLSEPVPSLRAVRETVPAGVEQAIIRALAKVPADRFATATQFAEALSQPVGREAARRRWAIPAGATVLVVAAVGAWLVIRANRPTVIRSASVIAVLPFSPSVPDTALSRLGRDLVFTVSAGLEGVGEIHAVDPHAVLAQGDAPVAGYSLGQGRSLARRFGAGSLVQGSLVRVGGEVRLDLSLFPTDSGAALAVASVTNHPDSLAALTDSITRTLLRQIWQRGTPPTPSLEAALQTHSAAALRAFLEGEQHLSENRWFVAADAYARAIAADSSFWLAYWRHIYALSWWGHEVDPKEVEAYRTHRFQLPEVDRLIIESNMVQSDSLTISLARARLVTQRYPDNWLAWMNYGDILVHEGPLLGLAPEEARVALRRALELNPRLLPAWEHLAFVDLLESDTVAVAADLDTLTKLNAGPILKDAPGGQDEMLHLRFLSRLERGAPLAPAFLDSVVREVASHDWIPLLLPGGWGYGFGRAGMEIDQRVLELGVEPSRAAGIQRAMGTWWAGRGAWDSALAAVDRYVRASAGTDSTAPLRAYRLAVLAAWVGGAPPAEADRRRAAASQAAAHLDAGQQVAMLWLDGLLAFVRQDRAALSSARAALERIRDPSVGVAARALRAMDLALTGATRQAAESLAALQWQQAERGDRDFVDPSQRTVGRMLAARWLTEAGDTAQALRLLAWNDAFAIPDGPAGRGGAFLLYGLAYLERARLEEARGQGEVARAHYERFLRFYDAPVAAHRHLVEEARAALRRLSGQGDPPPAKP